MTFTPAEQPTLYFIGVTTGQSSIMRVFPAWASHLGLKDTRIQGMDFALHTEREAYRRAVTFIKDDPLSCGALVTTHKLDLFAACRDLFEIIDPLAALTAETSCLSKKNGALACHAKDPLTAGLAIDGFLPPQHFADTGGALFCMGAGGASIAITWHLLQPSRGADRPSKIVVSDRSEERLHHIRTIHQTMGADIPVDYVTASGPAENDAVLAGMPPASLVINATGLGKDAPGSPLGDGARFPERAIAWDLNYRGDLVFLDQARGQAGDAGLQVEDGWTYFLHGWTQVIAEVFGIAVPTSGPDFEAVGRVAAQASGRAS
ncbi:shikimate dehydrogenase [Pelagibius sp.]|uniref:shikimate dehydrogenase family protein n=1 Tax=Pelagibius sp. TaxID=1931238 RepID=UPI00260A2B7B|nr:shikimate dehydrogenase [Pelagibius sp.]